MPNETIDGESVEIRDTVVAREDPPPPDPMIGFEETMTDRRPFAKPSIHAWPRTLEQVTGICLHQTACHMGENDARYDKLCIHFVVRRSGKIIRLHDFEEALAGGNGWNNGTVQIEFDGLYPGQEDDPSTLKVNEAMRTTWDDPTTPFRETPMVLTDEQVESGLNLLRWLIFMIPSIRVIVAHRQSSGSRESDPGEAIWRRIANVILIEYGLNYGGDHFKLDDGRPIPECWGGAVGVPY